MAFRRYLTVLASFIVALEVFFIYIASNLNYQLGGGSLRGRGVTSRSGGGRHRQQQKSTTSKYTPDYTKFNTSHPPILSASSPGSIPSLPDSNRVPQSILDSQNFSHYYSNWTNGQDPHTLFSYNPSIVPLFSSVSAIDSTKRMLSPRQHLKNVQYLASFRVSSIHSCGFPTYEFWKYPIDYVGLALLDDGLKVATLNDDSLDIIVDVNDHLPKIFHGRIKFQDVRLFVLNDRVFMSSGRFLVPICVKIDGIVSGSGDSSSSSPAICNDGGNNDLEEIPALYRRNDRLRLFVTGDAIRIAEVDGKNFQFFHAGSKNESQHSKVLMEYWPMGPRLIHDLGNEIARLYWNISSKKKIVDLMRESEIKSTLAPDPRSKVSRSLDSSLKSFIKRDRSSACCVRVAKEHYADIMHSLPPSFASELEKLDSLLVGISHSKSRGRMPSTQGDRYNYLSRLFAFSPVEPYDLVARSGLFCFGFPNEHDAKSHGVGVGNEYNEFTQRKKLELYGATYECPNIHFVNSIIEKEDDESNLIVSLGVNDCVVS
ncbi:hypothetical protein ACHAXR_008016 [Thalassiosira sp. AJA248-18]